MCRAGRRRASFLHRLSVSDEAQLAAEISPLSWGLVSGTVAVAAIVAEGGGVRKAPWGAPPPPPPRRQYAGGVGETERSPLFLYVGLVLEVAKAAAAAPLLLCMVWFCDTLVVIFVVARYATCCPFCGSWLVLSLAACACGSSWRFL